MDYRMAFDNDWLKAPFLEGKEHVVKIDKVEAGEIKNASGKPKKQPVLHFEGRKLPLALNKTNAKTVARLYGNEMDEWVGKKITIYPTTTEMAGEVVDCIRIRPVAPK